MITEMMTSCTIVAAVALMMVFTAADGREISRDQSSAVTLNLRLATPENEEVYLTLTEVAEENSRLERIPTYVSGKRPGKIIRWTAPAGYSLKTYIDVESQASVVVQTTVDSRGRKTNSYRGSFVDNNRIYWLAPLLESNSRHSTPADEARSGRFQPLEGSVTVRIDNVDHFVAPAEEQSTDRYDNILSSSSLKEKSYSRKYDTRGKVVYTVELMIVVDYSLYNFWYRKFTNDSDPSRDDKATYLLQHYFAAIASLMDKRYEAMNQPDFDIDVVLVSFFFARTVADSQFTESSEVKLNFRDRYSYIQMNTCLKLFGDWTVQNAKSFTKFDHAVLFVGNNLYDKLDDDGWPSTKSGLAHMEGVCKVNDGLAVSINYERGFFSTSQTGAHELGHNLGSKHDSEDNNCKSSDQYVMAAAPGFLTDDIVSNPYHFSSCSVGYFRSFLSKLPSDNCLLKQESAALNINFVMPGLLQDVNTQCQNYDEDETFYCAGQIHDEELCTKIICWDPTLKKCGWLSSEHRAYLGTPCGDKKWCYMGKCIHDEKAPHMNATCIYGDYKGEMYIDEKNTKVTCAQLIRDFPEQCYNEHKSKQCCKACPSIQHLEKPDCVFGDRVPARCAVAKRVDCYDLSFRSDCCDWCEKQAGTDEMCIYGDYADWCATIEPAACYTDAHTCCETCKELQSSGSLTNSLNDDCKFGDKVNWCEGQADAKSCKPGSEISELCCGTCGKKFPSGIPSDADGPSADKPSTGTAKCPQGDQANYCKEMNSNPAKCYQGKDVCCATCEKLSSGIHGCEYGDQTDGCEDLVDSDYCKDSSVFEMCCKTCLQLQKRSDLDLIEKLLSKLD